jgi:hypothetical protein
LSTRCTWCDTKCKSVIAAHSPVYAWNEYNVLIWSAAAAICRIYAGITGNLCMCKFSCHIARCYGLKLV